MEGLRVSNPRNWWRSVKMMTGQTINTSQPLNGLANQLHDGDVQALADNINRFFQGVAAAFSPLEDKSTPPPSKVVPDEFWRTLSSCWGASTCTRLRDPTDFPTGYCATSPASWEQCMERTYLDMYPTMLPHLVGWIISMMMCIRVDSKSYCRLSSLPFRFVLLSKQYWVGAFLRIRPVGLRRLCKLLVWWIFWLVFVIVYECLHVYVLLNF